MSEETLISKMSTPAGMTVKIGCYQYPKETFDESKMVTFRCSVDRYVLILRSATGAQKRTQIPEDLYLALLAFENDPKF